MPVPWMLAMSTLCSCAMRRTSGDDFCRRSSLLVGLGLRRFGVGSRLVPAAVAASARGRLAVIAAAPTAQPAGIAPAPRRLAPSAAAASRRAADHRDDAVDRHRLPFLDLDLGQHARGRRRDLGVDLVGRDLEQRLVAIDRVADLLDPADDRAFGDRLAHLGHHDVGRHCGSLCSVLGFRLSD